MEDFYIRDLNDIFDDGILKYRDVLVENFSFKSDSQRANIVVNALFKTLIENSNEDSFADKRETFLTCRAVAEKLQLKIDNRFAEEYALDLIYQSLIKAAPITSLEIRQVIKALPEILSRPFPICKEIKHIVQEHLLPKFIRTLRETNRDWLEYFELEYIRQLLCSIR